MQDLVLINVVFTCVILYICFIIGTFVVEETNIVGTFWYTFAVLSFAYIVYTVITFSFVFSSLFN